MPNSGYSKGIDLVLELIQVQSTVEYCCMDYKLCLLKGSSFYPVPWVFTASLRPYNYLKSTRHQRRFNDIHYTPKSEPRSHDHQLPSTHTLITWPLVTTGDRDMGARPGFFHWGGWTQDLLHTSQKSSTVSVERDSHVFWVPVSHSELKPLRNRD